MNRARLWLLLAVAGMSSTPLPGCRPTAAPELAVERFAASDLSTRSQGAWKRLRASSWFGSSLNVWTWGMVDPARDALTLWKLNERAALLDIATGGTAEGRLWAASALRHMDPAAFDALTPRFQSDEARVTLQHGCIGSSGTVSTSFASDVMDDDHLLGWFEKAGDIQRSPEELLERARGVSARFADRASEEAFDELLQSTTIEVFNTYSHPTRQLLEREPNLWVAGLRLAGSPSPATRFWGAALLHGAEPDVYSVMRPHWERDLEKVGCTAHAQPQEHGFADALALHIETP